MKRSASRNVLPDYSKMSLSELLAHLEDAQHPYLRKALETFRSCSTILNDPSGKGKVHLLAATIEKLGASMEKHLNLEKESLFPLIKKMINTPNHTESALLRTIKTIKTQHTAIKNKLEKIRSLSNEYSAPQHSSPMLMLCYAQLFNFEQDVLKSIFLEEKLLFPPVLSLSGSDPK